MRRHKTWMQFCLLLIIQIELIAMEPTWYEGYDRKRYLIDTEEKYNWYQAWNECARYDAQLISIENEQTNHLVAKLLKNLNDKNKSYWIGGNVFYEKISFRWSSNEHDFTFTNWATEDMEKFTAQKHCVYIMRHRKSFPWHVENCYANSFGFVCEEIFEEIVEVDDMENEKKIENLNGPMYNGSIYSLIG